MEMLVNNYFFSQFWVSRILTSALGLFIKTIRNPKLKVKSTVIPESKEQTETKGKGHTQYGKHRAKASN